MDQCRNNTKNPQNTPNEIKEGLKKIAMEQGLYEKVVMIRRKDSENKKERENTKNITSKDNNQDQYVGLIFIMSG